MGLPDMFSCARWGCSIQVMNEFFRMRLIAGATGREEKPLHGRELVERRQAQTLAAETRGRDSMARWAWMATTARKSRATGRLADAWRAGNGLGSL